MILTLLLLYLEQSIIKLSMLKKNPLMQRMKKMKKKRRRKNNLRMVRSVKKRMKKIKKKMKKGEKMKRTTSLMINKKMTPLSGLN